MELDLREILSATMILFAVIDIVGSVPIVIDLRQKVNSFAVAGSFVLFFLAIEMILGVTLYKDEAPESASVVPLAFPLIAGAGTLTTLLSIRAEYQVINIIIAIILNIIFVYIVLKSSPRIARVMGQRGLGVIRKVFGVILLAIAVKLFATNINGLF